MHLRSGNRMLGSDEKRRRTLAAAIPVPDDLTLAAAIPDDLLIHEVLVHLPAKSLARCRCVCRSWRAGIAGAAFVRRHLEVSRARPLPSVLVIPREVDADDDQATSMDISFHRLPLPPPERTATEAPDLVFEKAWPEGITRIIHPTHCDGLVAIATTTDRVFVCNPATREFVALPLGSHNAKLDHDAQACWPVALGFDQWRNRYVVARHFYRTHGKRSFDEVTGEWSLQDDIGHEVFTLGGSGGGSWELTKVPPHAVGIQWPICTRRAFFWQAREPRHQLIRFGLQHRTFDVVRRPPTGWTILDDMAYLDDGTLCYVHVVGPASFEIWMTDEDDDAPQLQWSLRCRMDLDLPDPFPDRFAHSFMTVVDAGGDTLVAVVGERLCRCNAEDGSVEEVADMRRDLGHGRPDGSKYMGRLRDDCNSMHHYAVPYFESLVSLTACN